LVVSPACFARAESRSSLESDSLTPCESAEPTCSSHLVRWPASSARDRGLVRTRS